jgi:prepilin-type N-terminal cleavage/methylation domain-containing protein
MLNNKKGFTLVELLVVISIIGILSTFAIVSLNAARIKARDALRKGDMAQIRTALNLYFDEYDEYPPCNIWDEAEPDFGANNVDGADCYNVELTAALSSGARPIMPLMPVDPKNKLNKDTANGGESDSLLYRYATDADGSQYVIVYRLETEITDTLIRGY